MRATPRGLCAQQFGDTRVPLLDARSRDWTRGRSLLPSQRSRRIDASRARGGQKVATSPVSVTAPAVAT